MAFEIEQLLGYIPGFTECLVECANPSSDLSKMLMRVADLETIESVRVKMLLRGTHAIVIERVCRAVLPPEIFDLSHKTNVKLDPTWASGRLKSVVDEARAECPFLALRSSEGCLLTTPLGPDQAEQHLHRDQTPIGGRTDQTPMLRFLRCFLPPLSSQMT